MKKSDSLISKISDKFIHTWNTFCNLNDDIICNNNNNNDNNSSCNNTLNKVS